MSRQFQRGHKARISDLTAGTDLYIGVQIAGPGFSFDISCFGLDANEQLSDDRYFVFFNQPKSPEESIQQLGPQSGDTQSFRVTLDRVPDAIRRLSFTATIDGAGTMSQVAPGYLRIVAGGEEVARYAFDGSEFSTERAVMIGDLYFKDGWRFAAIGQGFDGGLDALLKNFGGEVLEEQQPAQPAGQTPGFAPPPAPAAPAPAFGAPAAPAPAFGAPAQPPAPAPAFGAPPQAPAPAFTPPPAPVPPQAPPGQFAPPGAPPAPPGQFGPPGGAPGQFAPPGAPPAPAVGGALPNPFGGPPPGGAPQPGQPGAYAVPQAAPLGLAKAMEPYRETPTGQRWALQNAKLVRADIGMGQNQGVLARQGSMVLYQGKVEFGYKSSGVIGRVTQNATGQEMQLMRCTGRGQIFFADNASYLHPIELQGDAICVSAENVLAFDETLQYEVKRVEGHGIPGGALFTMQFSGTGTVIVKTHGTPVVLPVTPTTYSDSNAIVAWSAAAQVVLSSQVRLRRTAYPGHSGETVNLQFRGAPGNFIVVQPYEV
ncbi:TerD family protein [Streptomyces polyrhachis]|uniref:TerD family protein n=1 Tax=Streptomyces polyrhachis TaxID=1282885 RepID=A0ABW2GKW9_9ACTN